MFQAIVTCATIMAALPAIGQELKLRMSDEMVSSGFDKQLLPRFKFKHRITVSAVTSGDTDMIFGPEGDRIFQTVDGESVHLLINNSDGKRAELAGKFRDWLRSDPGKAAIEGFRPNGEQIYSTAFEIVVVEEEEVFEGDEIDGSRLALVHCGRCHVVDERNRMGGIGSTPSFAAMRGREDWSSLFRAFFVHNPHPSFTQVDGVTEPFDPNKPLHIAPVEITLEEIEAITEPVVSINFLASGVLLLDDEAGE